MALGFALLLDRTGQTRDVDKKVAQPRGHIRNIDRERRDVECASKHSCVTRSRQHRPVRNYLGIGGYRHIGITRVHH